MRGKREGREREKERESEREKGKSKIVKAIENLIKIIKKEGGLDLRKYKSRNSKKTKTPLR